jgi:hypothetical protein
MAAVNLPDAGEIDPASFMPSSRSVAFRRAAIESAGGYPEWLDIGEDMFLDHRWRELGLDMRFAPEAIVRWRLRPTLRDTWVQYFRYARGDAIAGLHPDRHTVRFAAYGGAMLAFGSRGRLRRLATLGGAAWYAAPALRRAWSAFEDPGRRAAALAAVPGLIALTDVAKMAGYLAGTARRPA